jgi:hypothetical protein
VQGDFLSPGLHLLPRFGRERPSVQLIFKRQHSSQTRRFQKVKEQTIAFHSLISSSDMGQILRVDCFQSPATTANPQPSELGSIESRWSIIFALTRRVTHVNDIANTDLLVSDIADTFPRLGSGTRKQAAN